MKHRNAILSALLLAVLAGVAVASELSRQAEGLGGITSWTSATVTGTWTTNTTYTAQVREVGSDTIELRVFVNLSGAPNAADLYVDLPSGYTIDESKTALGATSSLGEVLGHGYLRDGSVPDLYPLGLAFDSTNDRVVVRALSGGTLALVDQATPVTLDGSDLLTFVVQVPVDE